MSRTTAVDDPLYGATPAQAVRRFFRRSVVFTGRASRSEFWWTHLFVVLVVLALGAIGTLLGAVTATAADRAAGRVGDAVLVAPVAILLFVLAVVVPGAALVVRRFHDAGFSGLLALLWPVPSVGGLVVLILCTMPTSPAGRRFDQDASGRPPGTPTHSDGAGPEGVVLAGGASTGRPTAHRFGAPVVDQDAEAQRLVMPDADVVVDGAGRLVRASSGPDAGASEASRRTLGR